ncbi:MAG: LapA family protein [Cyanobacteria bacterium J06642_3]
MKFLANLLNSLIVAGWISAIAVVAIQNIQDVSLKFLFWQSIKFPIGVLLALCLGVGYILGAFLPLFWQKQAKRY